MVVRKGRRVALAWWLALAQAGFGLCSLVHAAALNDSGFASCADLSGTSLACAPSEPGSYPRQDGRYGRDAAAAAGILYKVGGGTAGFDFTKIANDGSELDATAALGSNPGDWACTRDNVTGWLWEVKTTSGLRSQDHKYTWYNTSNGGTVNGGTCFDSSNCDTEKFVAAVNATALCGYTDWRLPSASELQSIIDYSVDNTVTGGAVVDATYFPNTPTSYFWGANNQANDAATAALVGFTLGTGIFSPKSQAYRVRLVRGTP
jgi:hypothetical protein